VLSYYLISSASEFPHLLYLLDHYEIFPQTYSCVSCFPHYLVVVSVKLLELLGAHSSNLQNIGLDGPGIESRWGRDFPHPFKPAQGPTQVSVQFVPGVFPGGKADGAWC
jgi:hypothetical protein